MKIETNRKVYIDWIVISIFSASSRILETVAMILPLKVVFVLMQPDTLPKFWFESGLDIYDFIILITVFVAIALLVSRAQQVFAQRKVRRLEHDVEDEYLEKLAPIITKISAAILVMLIFIIIIGFIDLNAFAIILVLLGSCFIPVSLDEKSLIYRFYCLIGIEKESSRIRFTSQILFLFYFLAVLILTLQQDSKISITLLLSILLGRKLFSEFSRLRVGLLQKKELFSDDFVDI